MRMCQAERFIILTKMVDVHKLLCYTILMKETKIKSAALELYQIRCIQLSLTRDEAAKKFRCSWQFILSVLTYKRPMPEWMIKKMAEFLDVDEGVVGLAFGYYPEDWVALCRENPGVVYKSLVSALKSLKANPSLKTHPVRGKSRSQS